MMNSGSVTPESTTEARLRSRDIFLLPALGILTVCGIAAGTELVARSLFPATKNVEAGNCMVINDPVFGGRGVPNCVFREQMGEGGVTEYRFNSHGYRTDMEEEPKPPGAYRIVMVGTSFATGLRVPREQTFAALLPAELSRLTGRKVELYNEAIPSKLPVFISRYFNDVLEAKPDLILWVLTRGDVQTLPLSEPPKPTEPRGRQNWFKLVWRRINPHFAREPILTGISDLLTNSRATLMLRHYLFLSQSQYVKSYLLGSDSEMGYLRKHPSEEWQSRLRQFNLDAADLERKSRDAGVPVVAVFLPRGPHAAMVSMNEWPADDNPFSLDDQLRSIVTAYGGTYIDLLPEFRRIPHPEQYYFPVEGHPNAEGHALLAELLARELSDGVVPALQAPASAAGHHPGATGVDGAAGQNRAGSGGPTTRSSSPRRRRSRPRRLRRVHRQGQE